MTSVAGETLGKRRPKQREMWIQERTWKLIDGRKSIKAKQQQARTAASKTRLREQYKEAGREVKRSCRKDKEEWFQQMGVEAQEAANQNDTKTLHKIVEDLTGSSTSTAIPVKR